MTCVYMSSLCALSPLAMVCHINIMYRALASQDPLCYMSRCRVMLMALGRFKFYLGPLKRLPSTVFLEKKTISLDAKNVFINMGGFSLNFNKTPRWIQDRSGESNLVFVKDLHFLCALHP